MKVFKNLTLILDHPMGAGNIGAVARAMKNMGMENLSLVEPVDYLKHEGLRMAMGAQEILKEAKVFSSLKEALEGFHLVIGTSRRKGRIRKPLMKPPEVAQKVVPALEENRVALVFGNEKDGLDNDQLFQCHLITTIPASPKQPSFNLAQAVMIYSYEIFMRQFAGSNHSESLNDFETHPTQQLADQISREKMFETMDISLARIGFYEHGDAKSLMRSLRQLYGKANLTNREVRILRGIFGKIQHALDIGLPDDFP